MKIPFNKIYNAKNESDYVLDALSSGRHAGNNSYCRKVIDLMKHKYSFREVFLTPSCTAALEMGAVLADIKPGDEVILPSYTFSSTANAVVLFGAIPVFCEVEKETMNIDVTKIEKLITPKTKMILPIDYAGVSCEIEKIMNIAKEHNIVVLHDCAQSYGGRYRGRPVGTDADLTAFSFHETKNYNAGGEGGALVVNRHEWIERASFIQEKGTDRSQVLYGLKNKYSWVDKGSSYLLSDILAAVLLSQLEEEDFITSQRSKITREYFKLFSEYEKEKLLNICQPNIDVNVNHHAFWVIFSTIELKEYFINELKKENISVYIGYIPLHSSQMGRKFGYKPEDLPLTEDLASRIVRLPFYTTLAKNELQYCVNKMKCVLDKMLTF